ncbi:Multidrug resistance efflux pump [Shimia gijangensis]|uniref:Multidrug resistance efflux pump n=1 Tax=Shimia gijangensis TaxID=1470563 RepID=A0A1M6J7M1_9RHOB|nr:biotin/lipoyl-binding protein [Shimia gijangensis]SHJ42670.1 Multidrug resistance efflux pump [Shimia gijangensis]
MIIILTLPYVALLFVLTRMKILPSSPAVWGSIGGWVTLLLIFLFIPMQWGAPSGAARIMTRVVSVVPNVSGQVVEVAAQPNAPMQQGDVLFRIDPLPFQHSVDQAEATLVRVQTQAKQDVEALEDAKANFRRAVAAEELAQSRFDDDKQLVESEVYSANRLEKRQSDLDQATAVVDSARAAVSRADAELGAVMPNGVPAKVAEAEAQLEQARWNLDQTVVRAPGEGFVTNLALAVGQRAVNLPLAPSMAFVDTSESTLFTQIHQIYLRHIAPGQGVEFTMKKMPGLVYTGTVDTVIPAASSGQAQVSGMVAPSSQVFSEPFQVRITVDDPELLAMFDPGSVGTVAIYTDSAGATHIIRKVMLRLEAILNYINPVL